MWQNGSPNTAYDPENLGMKVFLLTDCIINKTGKDISCYPHGGFDELISFIDGLK